MRKLLLNPTPLFRKLRQLSMLLTLLLALPQTAWGEEVTKTYTFTGTTLSGNAGTATSNITGGTVAETYTWNIKDFSREASGYAYNDGIVTPSNSKLGFSGEGISRKFENYAYHAVKTTFVLESEAFTGEFVSATIDGYTSTGMSTAKVQVLRDEGTQASPLSYNTTDDPNNGYTNLSSTTSLPMSTSEVHTSNKYLNGNKLRFIFMFESDNSNNASFEIGSITITTGPIEYDLKVENTQVTAGNASNILVGTGNDGKVSYDATQNILTLNEANLSMPIQTNINNLIIELKGENKINTNAAESTIKRISSNETLNLTIRPASTDPLGSINLANLESSSTSLVDGFNLSLGGELFDYPSLNNSSTHNSYITSLLIGGQMVAKTGAVFSDHSKIIFDNTSNTNVLTISGVSSELNSNKIISGLSNLTINYDGANTITMGDTATVITSTNSNSVLTFTKASDASSLTISNTGMRSVIHGFNSINYGDGIYTSTPAPATYINTPNNGLMSALDNTKPINSLSLSSNPSYQLWVAGTQATSTTSETGWSYDATNNKLTLTNYNKTDNDGHAFISNMANLNVYLVGTNTVGKQALSAGKAFYTTYTDATLTFSTDENNKGTLSASGYDTFCEGFRAVNGIYCNNGLGYYPSSKEIKAKATPTIKFAKRDQTSGAELSPAEYVGASETLQTAVNSAFKAPRPEYDNDYQLFVDSTRYTYSYAPEGIVEIPVTATDPSTGNNTFGEMNILKAGTVTITCTYPGSLQNEACSASYTLKVNKADANLAYDAATSIAYIDLSGNGQWGDPNGTGGTAPTLTKPTNVTGITYTSSNTNVATVSSTGDVTPIGAGEATITATLSNNDSYNDGNASYQLTVMVPATISFANATASVLNMNTATYTQAATTDPAGSTITYSSSNNDVNVDANGQVTISNQSFYGPVTITATLTAVPAANPQYYYVQSNNAAFQATYTLNVAKEFNYVNFASGQSYATCILSEKLTKPDGLKVYYITGTNGNTVTTQEIDYLPDGIPILLEKTAATIGSVTARTDSSSVVSGNLLQYATSDVSATGNQYVLYKNEFVKATGTINRACYLDLNGVAPTRGMYGIGNDGSTAIEGIDVEATEDETWYDLQGRRIQKPTKAGIYIVNGKKVIINNK